MKVVKFILILFGLVFISRFIYRAIVINDLNWQLLKIGVGILIIEQIIYRYFRYKKEKL